VHHRSAEFRYSIFPNSPPSDPPPARLRSIDRSHSENRSRIDLLYHSSSTMINIRNIRIRQLVQTILFMTWAAGEQLSEAPILAILVNSSKGTSSTPTKKAAMRNRAASAMAVEDRRPTSVSHRLLPECGSRQQIRPLQTTSGEQI
ncbi:hypothetical protein ACLOJK_037995, partial [Asimina triloba]